MLFACLLAGTAVAQSPVTLTVDTQSPGYAIPADFSGLSFETMTLLPDSTGGYWFSATNTPLITLFQNLGLKSLRIGGATVDMATVAIPTNNDIDHLFAFAQAAGVKVIYSLRLLNGSTNTDATLAQYIWTHYRTQLDSFAIGNEPDWNSYHQSDPNITNYTSYLADWQKFATAITNVVPGATFSGPDTGGNVVTGAPNNGPGPTWTTSFALAEEDSGLIACITQHDYVGEGAGNLTAQQGIEAMLSPAWNTSSNQTLYTAMGGPVLQSGLPYRFTEANDFTGGVTNASNAFASALWALDFMQWWAAHGASGVNFHNKRWIPTDTIIPGSSGQLITYPKGYGIKAFDLGSHGYVEPLTMTNASGLNLTAYAVGDGAELYVTIINKEQGTGARDAAVTIVPDGFSSGSAAAVFLTVPNGNVAATDGVALGGAAITNNASWLGQWTTLNPVTNGQCTVIVSAASAAVVKIQAGTQVRAVAHVINDADDGSALANVTLVYQVQAKNGGEFCQGRIDLPDIPYFGAWSKAVTLDLPASLATGDYVISGRIMAGSHSLSTNAVELFIAGAEWRRSAPSSGLPVHLYDPAGKTAAALEQAGLGFKRLSSLSPWPADMTALVIAEGAWDKALGAQKQRLRQFIHDGGRVLCLGPVNGAFERDWLPEQITPLSGSPNDPAYPPRTRPFREQMNVNPERPGHPVFRGLDRHRLALWSDYTGWDETKPGFPQVYPVTAGFKLLKPEALARTAILADYDRGLEGVALCEMFDGAGSVILSGFDLVRRAGLDPAADRLLANLVAYAASTDHHPVHPLIEQPIQWGNYPTERGVVCGTLNGLIVNAEWLAPPTNPSAPLLPPNTGSWNMDPGSQFEPRGRNPFGPYTYSTGSSLKDLNPDSAVGSGVFWASLPPSRKTVLTKVKNPAASPGQLTIAINGNTATGPVTIPASQTLNLRSPLPAGVTNVSVRYTGPKTLVLLETSFE
ncbi:MAG: glycosyl hydrolase family 79 C-terminal domain-containing protein [Verrucomicrobiota bacterium]